VIEIPRSYGYGRTRSKKVGKYEIQIEFHDFKKARFSIYKGNKDVYYSGSDSLTDKKEKVLDRYRSLKNVKSIESFVKKRKSIK